MSSGKSGTGVYALDKLAADYAGQVMDNLNVLERFIERPGENRTLLQHLADAFRSLIDRVGGRYRVNAKNAVTLLGKALDDGARAAKKAERQKAKENAATKGDGAQYAIMETRDGKKYVRADRQVIFGNDPEKWAEQLENYINGKIRHGQDVVLIGADGDELRLTETSAGKLSDNHTSDGRTMSAEAYERKADAAAHIDELVHVSNRKGHQKPDEDGRHGEMASGGWAYRTAFFEDFDGTYYNVTISASINDAGKMVYNIGQMKEEAHPKIKGSRASYGDGPRGFASSGNRVHNSDEIVKSRQSIKESDTNAQQAGTEENAEKALAAGVELDASSESAAPASYSLKTWLDSDYVTDSAEAAKAIAAQLGVSVGTARRYIRSINGIAKMIADDRERLDYEASPDRSSFVSNSEYGGSIDFSTICAKRRLLTGTLEAIQRELPNTALTAEEVLSVRKMMAEMGYVVSCGLCYVEGSRAKMGEYTKEFLDEYAKTNPAYLPNMAEMNTATGQEQIRLEHPEVYDAYVKFMNKLAQRKPKMYQLATEYKGEVLSKFGNKRSAATVAAKNRNGGLRLQSFSDFEIIHLLDCMQVITDMSRVGLAGQAYTKVPDFARALGKTGLKINLSLIAKGVDSNGNIVLDEVEGMARADAEQLRNKYSANVGTILVTFTDEQLMAAMKDPFIDFIIPFHRSQWGKAQYTMLGLPAEAKDYTPWQNESYIEPVYNESRNAQRPSNYIPNEYWDFSRSGKENAETYLKMCAENNRVPKFSNLLVKNADGSYSLQPDGSTDGYWKLLIDFKMYTNGGKGAPQRPVKPRFDMREARRMLNEYEGGHESFPVAQDIVDEFVAQYKQTHPGKQYSLKEDDETYLNAVREGDMLTAQRMVEKAAKAAGYTSERLYHGTGSFGFTRIKTTGVERGTEWSPFFATNNIYTAMTYSGKSQVTEIGRLKRPKKSIGALRAEASSFFDDPDGADGVATGVVFAGQGESYVEQYGSIMDEKTADLLNAGTEGVFAAGRSKFIFLPFEKGFSSEDYDNLHGNYGLYANTEGFLVIDGEGRAWNRLESEYGASTRSISKNAKREGYPGVLIKNIYDTGWGWDDNIDEDVDTISDVYIFFSPESQVKSADPVTYDDNGDVIPLSERFNSRNTDIRYDMKDDVDTDGAAAIESDIQTALALRDSGAAPSEVFNRTGLVLLPDGRLRNGMTGDIVWGYDDERRRNKESAGDGALRRGGAPGGTAEAGRVGATEQSQARAQTRDGGMDSGQDRQNHSDRETGTRNWEQLTSKGKAAFHTAVEEYLEGKSAGVEEMLGLLWGSGEGGAGLAIDNFAQELYSRIDEPDVILENELIAPLGRGNATELIRKFRSLAEKQYSMKNDDTHERLRQHLADVQREQNESAWDRLGAKITDEIKAAVQEARAAFLTSCNYTCFGIK